MTKTKTRLLPLLFLVVLPLLLLLLPPVPLNAQLSAGWTQYSNTKIGGNNTSCSGNCGVAINYPQSRQVIRAWGGGAFDTTRNRMIIWGGGHNDYSGNEIYAVDFDGTPTTLRLTNNTNPSGCSAASCDGGVTPNSRHTYDNMDYSPSDDILFVYSGGLAGFGNWVQDAWAFKFATMQWEYLSPISSGPLPEPQAAQATTNYDPVTNKFWICDGHNLITYHYPTKTFQGLRLNPNGFVGYPLGVIDQAKRRYYIRDISTGGSNIYYFDMTGADNYAIHQVVVTGAVPAGFGTSMTYDPVSQDIVLWSGSGHVGGNTVYRLNTTTHVMTAVTGFTGGPGAAQLNGTYGRFNYSPTLDAFVLVNDFDENAFAYRINAGAPPPDTQNPTQPTNPSASTISSTQINVTWTASTDNVGVTGYLIERCTGAACSSFSQIATSTVNSYPNTGLTPSTLYRYRVRATDAAANLSTYSSIVEATTNAPPSGIITVGPSGRDFTTIPAAIAAAVSGNTIEIDAGTYTDQSATVTQSNLTLRGVGVGRAHMAWVTGNIPNGKGILDITGGGVVVENMEFSGAVVVDGNGAGIRYSDGGNLTIRGSYFHDNENGLLGQGGLSATLLVENSIFEDNGDCPGGGCHNVYIGTMGTLIFRYNKSFDSVDGHTLKTRARVNEILYNYLSTKNSNGSYEAEFPNGGTAYLIGNVIEQGVNTNNSTLVSYGAEGAVNPSPALYLVNNTLMNWRTAGATFVQVVAGGPTLGIRNNIWAGGGTPLVGGSTDLTSDLSLSSTTFVDASTANFNLVASSPAVNSGVSPGTAGTYNLTPLWEYVEPASSIARTTTSTIDVGAYESDFSVNEFVSTTCTVADVQAKMDMAAAAGNGSGVFLDCASATWAAAVSWTAPPNSYLRGRGSTSVRGGGDLTVITDNFASGSPVLAIETNATGTFRIYGITFRAGGTQKNDGVVGIGGQSKQFRMDHMHFDTQTAAVATSLLQFSNYVTGVVDQSIFDLHSVGNGIKVHYRNYGGTQDGGDASWAAPTGFGTSDFVFVENNTFNGNSAFSAINDALFGGKMVIRYNTINRAWAQTHPTRSGSERGARAMEVYGNDFVSSNSFNPVASYALFFNAGPAMVWGNNAPEGYTIFQTGHYGRRSNDGGAHAEAKTPDGWAYCGPAPQSGTVNVSGTNVTRVSGTNFNTNWAADSMIFIGSDISGYRIASVNSINSITLVAPGAGTQTGVAYSTGSNWDGNTEPLTGYPCLDQPGRGQGDLITGAFPNKVNAATGCNSSLTCAYPRQVLEPVYNWLNVWATVPGFGGTLFDPSSVVVENRDYYLQTSSFNGATGVGSGIRAARPAAAVSTNGVAFWSTDFGGNWNTSNGSANDGCLDKMVAGTWQNCFYIPYTYPHPLASSGSSLTSISPSSGTQGTAQITVTLTGSNTVWSNGATALSFSGTGITVNSTTCTTSTACSASIAIGASATVGTRNVLMTTGAVVETLSNGFTVNALTASKVGFTVQPPTSVNSAATIPTVSAAIQFASGATDTSSSAPITIAICGGSPAGTLSGTLTKNAISGVVNFTDLSISSVNGGAGYTLCISSPNLTSAASNSFSVVSVGSPTKLTYTTQPPITINSAAIMPTVRVAVQFSNSTTDTSATNNVTMALCMGSPAGTLGGTLTVAAVSGIASFTNLTVTSTTGGSNYTLCATSTGLTGATSDSFTVNVPPAPSTKLGFTTQPPSTTTTGATLSTVVVAVQFATGATNTTATNNVTIALCSGSPAGTLSGTLTRAAVAGLASFNNLIVTSTVGGSTYTLCATSSGLTSATSSTFNVTIPPPIPTKLTLLTQPPSTIASGVTFSPINVAVQFSNGTTDTSSTASVFIGLCSGSPAGNLGGTTTVAASSGIASFTNLSVTTSTGGTGYALCASSSSLTNVTSNTFTVTVPSSPCQTTPLVVRNVKWPVAPTGSRSLGWNSGSFQIASVRFIYPGTALFTDSRGCQVTVTK